MYLLYSLGKSKCQTRSLQIVEIDRGLESPRKRNVRAI